MSIINEGLDLFGNIDRGTRHRLIACEVAYRELCLAAAVSKNVIDLLFLTQGLHDLQSASMAARIQAAIDATPEGRYQAILLGFGLCNCGIVGVKARKTPLVLPRAHDCITLFLGSKQAYQKHFDENKGTFYLTTGWVERDKENIENTMDHEDNMLRKMGLDKTFEEYAALYGEEYAKMIMGTLTGMEHYRKLSHIQMDIASEAESRAQTAGQDHARERGWAFDTLKGRMDLFLALVNGDGGGWDEERFLIVQPGQAIQQAYDERIVRAE
jgi:hypothetical protein